MNILLWQAAVLPGLAAELEAFSNTSLLQFFQQQPDVVLALLATADGFVAAATCPGAKAQRSDNAPIH